MSHLYDIIGRTNQLLAAGADLLKSPLLLALRLYFFWQLFLTRQKSQARFRALIEAASIVPVRQLFGSHHVAKNKQPDLSHRIDHALLTTRLCQPAQLGQELIQPCPRKFVNSPVQFSITAGVRRYDGKNPRIKVFGLANNLVDHLTPLRRRTAHSQ
jgi:hypothetical protein